MKFASTKLIIILTIVTSGALFGLDFWKNPQLWHAKPELAAPGQGQRLTLWMNHLCCTACLDNVRQALAGMEALDMANAVTPQLMTQEQANQTKKPLPDYGNKIEVPIKDIQKLDFVAVDRALRDHGMVAGRMELSGVEHFSLEAKLDHFCCGMCERATTDKFDFMKAKGASGNFKWLDSVNVDHESKTIIAYARYLQPGKTLDVGEFITGLNDIGFAPHSVLVVLGDKMHHVHPAATAPEEPAGEHPHESDQH